MCDKIEVNPEEAYAVSLATFSVLTNTLRLLRDRGALSQEEVGQVLASAQATLETSAQFSQPVLHNAHQMIAALAGILSVPVKKPN